MFVITQGSHNSDNDIDTHYFCKHKYWKIRDQTENLMICLNANLRLIFIAVLPISLYISNYSDGMKKYVMAVGVMTGGKQISF